MGTNTKKSLKDFLNKGKNKPVSVAQSKVSQQIFMDESGLQNMVEQEENTNSFNPTVKQEGLNQNKQLESKSEVKADKAQIATQKIEDPIKKNLETIKQKPLKKEFKQLGDSLKNIQSRKMQMMFQSGVENNQEASPLQINFIQSESLRVAQEKIDSLEDELMIFREKNESLISAGEFLQDKNNSLKLKLEDIERSVKEEKNDFKEEKYVLLKALSSAKESLEQLLQQKKELENKLSGHFYDLRHRESSLEGRIEILKMENSVLQREKDKTIIELKKNIHKIKYNLAIANKKNQDLQTLNNELQASARRAISALRATIFNLEDSKKIDETIFTHSTQLKKIG